MDNHQPAETIAWIVVILTVPFIGLIFYYFFGQDIRRGRRLNKKKLDILTHKVMAKYVKQEGDIQEDHPHASLIHFLKLHNHALPFSQNTTQIYNDGETFFIELLKSISKAQHHIHMEFYIFRDDSLGQLIKDSLIEAAKRGVVVRIIYDDLGCWGVKKDFFEEMKNAGIELSCFLPVRFHRLAHRINYRNHRKLVIIDGEKGYIGGMNIALRYARPTKGRIWTDTHLKVEGRGVYGIQLLFLSDWLITTNQTISDPVYYPSVNQPDPHGCLMQIVSSAPLTLWPSIMLAYNKVILNAKKHILIQTPYFMPTQSLIESLQVAAMSGVKVKIMLPEKPGGFWMTWCNRAYFSDMLKAGAEIYLYTKGMLHSKTLTTDDNFCSIGSANIDFRSMLDTFEDSAFIYDEAIAQQMRHTFTAMCDDCKKVELQEWENRPLRKRLLASFVRMFSPLF